MHAVRIESKMIAAVAISLYATILQACEQWGYQGGPSYKTVMSRDLHYVCSTKSLEWSWTAKDHQSFYFYKGDSLLAKQLYSKDFPAGNYKIPDSILSKADPLKINVDIDKYAYEIEIYHAQCRKSDTTWAMLRLYE